MDGYITADSEDRRLRRVRDFEARGEASLCDQSFKGLVHDSRGQQYILLGSRCDAGATGRINRHKNTPDMQMNTHPFSGQDLKEVLVFLVRFDMAYDHNGLTEEKAV